MPEDWKRELEKIKEMTEKEVLEIQKKKTLLRDKYEEDKKRITDLIYSKLKAVEKVLEGARIRKYEDRIEMYCPFVICGKHKFSPSISFYLILTKEGYKVRLQYSMGGMGNVKLLRSIFGHDCIVISSPVRKEDIEKEIKAFLQKRSRAIVYMEEYCNLEECYKTCKKV